MTRIVEYCGLRALAGLNWELPASANFGSIGIADQIMARLKQAMKAPPAAQIMWEERQAALQDPKAVGMPALSRVVMELLPEEMKSLVVLVAIAEPDAQLFTTFILAAGKPVLGPERLYPDLGTMRTAIGDMITSGDIQAVAAASDITGFDGLRLPLITLVQTDIDPRTLPVAQPGSAPIRTAAAVVGAGAALALAGAYLADDLRDLVSPRKPQVTVIVPKVPEWGEFVAGCIAAHDEDWPSVPGWRPFSRGCRIGAPDQPAIAWRSFQLENGRNLIIAQRVAEMMYREWPHRVSIAAGTLSTETDIALSWKDAPQTSGAEPAPIERQAEDAFVGIERAIVVENASIEPVVQVTSDAPLQDVFDRVARLESYWIDSIEVQASGTQLRLRPAPKPVIDPGASN